MSTLNPRIRNWGFGLLGVLLALAAYLLVPSDEHPKAPAMAAMVVLMAVWWIFEVIPIPATSLIPIVFMPLAGITDVEAATANYGKSTIFLFLGGFVLALGMQESNVHKRLALHILKIVGTQPRRLVLGFMIATALMSMWISNVATVMVMLPISLSVLDQASSSGDFATNRSLRNFATALMLGIAYAADIGGMATLIGTAPNMAFRQILADSFPDAPRVEFVDWMKLGIPVMVLFIFSGWQLLVRVAFPIKMKQLMGEGKFIDDSLKALGKIRRDEILTLSVFGIAALLWLTGSKVSFGESIEFSGWREILDLKGVDDAVVAVACALLLFLIPSGDRKGEALITWETARKLPWGILLLFGGGFAIAKGFSASGLSELVGDFFAVLPASSPILLVLIISIILTFLTEITSNTAITNLVLPILAKASVVMGIDPRILMIPATISASCAFMMPVASPTQAIVFGTGHINIRQMIKGGIWFNMLGVVIISLLFLLLSNWAFGIEIGQLPEWAKGH